MSKLFSNISLEARWKDSPYKSQVGETNNQSIKTQPTPTINAAFASNVSLVDRLRQSISSGTTEHLPEYFLSDVYTKYITIIPTKTFQHTSSVIIKKPKQQVAQSGIVNLDKPKQELAQGGITPKGTTFNSILFQGTSLVNGIYKSFVLTKSSVDSVNQGPGTTPTPSVISVNQGPGTTPALSVVTINQGPGTTPTPSVILVNQGPGTDPTEVISAFDLGLLQGLSTGRGGTLTSLTPIKVSQASLPINIPKSVVITKAGSTPNQGGVSPKKITFNPQTKTPTLNLLRYEADRALAYFSPIVKHGYTDLTKFFTGNGNVDGASNYYYNNLGGVDIPTTDISLRMADNIDSDISDLVFQRSQTNNKSTISRGLAEKLGMYKVLDYDTIVDRSKAPSPTVGKMGDFNGVKQPIKRDLGPLEMKYPTAEKDIINFSIASLTGQGSVQFRAYLTSFSDSYTPTWNDINYVARQDTLKTFKGVTRNVSIGFKIAAFSLEEHKECYEKLNKLVKIAAVGTFSGKYLVGPLCSLTLGSWFKKTPVAATSIKYDIDAAEITWDIDTKLPQLLGVSIDFAVLGDNDGKTLNAKTNKYFNYVW